MTKTIIKIKSFSAGNIQPSAYNDNGHDYSSAYALIEDNWYRYTDLFGVVGEEYDGSLLPITQDHLNRFTEENGKGFFKI